VTFTVQPTFSASKLIELRDGVPNTVPNPTQTTPNKAVMGNRFPHIYPNQSVTGVNIDPQILRAAKQVYRQYIDSYASQLQRPLGIAINRTDMTGKLVFNQIILLPQETFVSIETLETPER
jgi:hypothetical protein